jgi:hypothetical protein
VNPSAIHRRVLKDASWENPFPVIFLQKLADANPHATRNCLFVLFSHHWSGYAEPDEEAAKMFCFAWRYVKFGRHARERLEERTNDLVGRTHWWRPHLNS